MHLHDTPRFTYTTSTSPSTPIQSSTWTDILTPDFLAQQASQKTPSSPTWWLDVRDATEQDVAVLSQALNIHPLTAEDIATRETREKVEVFRTYYLISFQTLVTFLEDQGPGTDEERAEKEKEERREKSRNRTGLVALAAGGGRESQSVFQAPKITSKTPASAVFFILVFNTGTVTFSPSGCSHVARVRDRVRRLHDEAVLSSDWICYALM